MNTKSMRTLVLVLAGTLPVVAAAFPWDEDMRDQPSIKRNETQVQTNHTSVPSGGAEPFEVPANTGEVVQDRLEAGATLVNPAALTPESITRGKALYDTHCGVCHGDTGHGDGMVGQKFIPPPMDLTLEYVQLQPDGQLFYTITHGSIAMPYYRDSIPEADRWHIVNYVKQVLKQ